MAFDFMKDSMMSDDTKFIKLCESIEDCIREVDGGEGRYSDLEIMQAINFVGFNFFEFTPHPFYNLLGKNMRYYRDSSQRIVKKCAFLGQKKNLGRKN